MSCQAAAAAAAAAVILAGVGVLYDSKNNTNSYQAKIKSFPFHIENNFVGKKADEIFFLENYLTKFEGRLERKRKTKEKKKREKN